MAKQVKNNDFVEIDFTGRTADDSVVFDTTIESVAKDSNVYNPTLKYNPYRICIGRNHILKILDNKIDGSKEGDVLEVDVKAEEAFGKKEPELVQLISTSKFKKHGINPTPGLKLNVDGMMGIVKTVSGGRTMVDFNHPLAGKDLHYTINVNKVIDDEKEKVDALLTLVGVPESSVAVEDKKIIIIAKIPEDVQGKISKEISECISKKDVTFNEE